MPAVSGLRFVALPLLRSTESTLKPDDNQCFTADSSSRGRIDNRYSLISNADYGSSCLPSLGLFWLARLFIDL